MTPGFTEIHHRSEAQDLLEVLNYLIASACK